MAFVSICWHLLIFILISTLAQGQFTISTTTPPPSSSTASAALPISSTSSSTWWEEQWDVVVVGSGPGGIIGIIFSLKLLTLSAASKCASHQANLSVLLLEAGGPSYAIVGNTAHPEWLNGANISRVDCPGLYNSIFDTSISSSQDLLCNSAINAFSGCTVGGCSAINAGLYFKPPDSDWNSWNITCWSSENMENSTLALQSAVGNGVTVPSTDGELYVQSSYAVMSKCLSAGGYSEVDLNSQGQYNLKAKVYGHAAFDSAGGQRGGPVATYLQNFLAHGNRTMLAQYVNVTRVIRTGSRASGVEVYDCSGGESLCQRRNVSLSDKLGQVILSAGTLSTPKILYFSGVGPSDILERLNGAGLLYMNKSGWIINENVGCGLYDNPNTFVMLQSPQVQAYAYGYNGTGIGVQPGDLIAYRDHRSGPYSSPGQTAVFFDSVQTADGRTLGIQGTVSAYGYADYQCPGCFTLNIYGTSNLRSRGRVNLDNNWVPTPSNDTIYQTNTTDADDIASYIHQLMSLLGSANLTSLNIPQNSTQDQIRQYITSSSPYTRGNTNHWGGSTKLSESCDDGVVSPNAKVCGMDNVYIVDGGIIPSPFSVNPQYGIMVASEHATNRILADRENCCGCLGQLTDTCPVSTSTIPSSVAVATFTPTPSVHSGSSTVVIAKGSIYKSGLWGMVGLALAKALF